jgi:hypothetical protein
MGGRIGSVVREIITQERCDTALPKKTGSR